MALKVSVTLCEFARLFRGDLNAVIEAAGIAEACGVDQVGLPDHLAVGPGTDKYPYGDFRELYPESEPWPEPLTLLACIAGLTSSIRLTTSVLIAPLRSALLLAKTAATLDVISGGRLDLAVGTGWQREELEAGGVPFVGRNDRMDDTLRACRALWLENPASFTSATVSFEKISSLPQPVQKEGIPLWFGGDATPRNVSRIAEMGTGWFPVRLADSDEFASGLKRIHNAMIARGRSPQELEVKAGLAPIFDKAGNLNIEATLGSLEVLESYGVTLASLGLPGFVRSADEVRPFLENVGAATLRDR